MRNLLGLVVFSVVLHSCGNKNKTSSDKNEVVNQVQLMEQSRNFNNLAIEAMGKIVANSANPSSFNMTEESMASIAQFYKKALKEARKVDADVLNNIHSDYGKMYNEKYIKSLELREKGLHPEYYGKGSFVEGQILYDEFVEWEQSMQNEMRKRYESKNSGDISI